MYSKVLKDFNVDKWDKKTIVVYGAGKVGRQIGNALKSKEIDDFIYCDAYIEEDSFIGKKIIRPESVSKFSNIIIGSSYYIIDIYKKLQKLGINNNFIFTANNLFCESKRIDNRHSLVELNINHSYEQAISSLNAYLNDGYVIEHLDLIITEICTLNCEACGSLMPLYVKPQNCDEENVIKGLDALLKSNCYIKELCIIGGEPFVNQKLMKQILVKYKDNRQIATFMTISNGTLLPTKEVLTAMKSNGKFIVVFSNYGNLSKAQEKAVQLLDEYGIESAIETKEDIVGHEGRIWIDYGKVKHYDFKYDKHQNMFLNCNERLMCTTLLNGKLFLCPRIAHAVNLGLIPSGLQGNYLDLLHEEYINSDNKIKQNMCINYLKNEEHPIACEYCNRDAGILVERAKQISREIVKE